MSTKNLNILMIENSDDDVKLVRRFLQAGGLRFDNLRVSTVNELQQIISEMHWDLILSDYSHPGFVAIEALTVLAAHDQEIPFIVLSSHGGEEAACTLMELGAHDYVMKTNMTRLVPAIQRSLREVDNFQQVADTQVALQKSEARFRAITSNLPGVVFQCLMSENNEISFPYVSDGSVALLGLSPQTIMENPSLFPGLILPKDKWTYEELMTASAKYLSTWNWEGCIQAKGDNDIKWISLRASPRRTKNGATLWDGIMINISRNKLAEREIARSREQLAELASYLQRVKEHERAYIAREIHDDIGGTLTAIKCELQPCLDDTPRLPAFYQKKAQSIESLVDQVIDSTRRISLDLRPGILDCGIVAAIRWQVKEFAKRNNIDCQVFCDNDDIPLDSDLSVAIFRLFQETLTNISKHADATNIRVKLVEKDGTVLLEVTDNGQGITKSDMEKQDSFGIRGMRERCQQLKGSFHVSGIPDKGTKVIICIPINNTQNHVSLANDPVRALNNSPPPASVNM